MFGYFLLIFLTIMAWSLVYGGVKYKRDVILPIGVVLSVLFTTLTVSATVTLGTKSAEADTFKENRDYYQELVNSISNDMSPTTVARIISTAENTNAKIENNRGRCGSKMWGFLANKKIAEVELIKIPKYKFLVEVEE